MAKLPQLGRGIPGHPLPAQLTGRAHPEASPRFRRPVAQGATGKSVHLLDRSIRTWSVTDQEAGPRRAKTATRRLPAFANATAWIFDVRSARLVRRLQRAYQGHGHERTARTRPRRAHRRCATRMVGRRDGSSSRHLSGPRVRADRSRRSAKSPTRKTHRGTRTSDRGAARLSTAHTSPRSTAPSFSAASAWRLAVTWL